MAIVRLEAFQESHLPRVLEIEKVSNTAPWSETSFRNEIGREHGAFQVILVDGVVAGYLGIWYVIDEAHITTLAVDPAARGQRLGLRLMNEGLAAAKAAGMVCSTLEVRASNEPALKLYEKLGYVVSNRRKGYYPDNREDAIVMWLHDLLAWTPVR